MKPTASVVLLWLCCAGSVAAQANPGDQARQLLEEGRQYRAKGQTKQAFDNFTTILSGFATTDSAPLALLEIGRYHIEVDGNVEKGRDAFEQVTKRFPQSDAAPGAYFELGALTLSRSASAADLDDALAQFRRVQTLYPRSPWVPRALHASSLVLRKAGKLEEATDASRRVALEHPTSDAAPAAQFEIGHCLTLLGQYRAAMEEFQRVRNAYPESAPAAQALDRITALFRLYAAEKPVFTLDPAYSLAAGEVLKDVKAILMTPERRLWIASERTKSAVAFDAASPKMAASLAVEDPRSLSLSPRGELVVAGKLAAKIGPKDVRSFATPSDKPGESEPVDRINAVALLPSGTVLVADDKRKRVLRFDAAGKYLGTFVDNRDREVTRIVVDGEGAVHMLDRDEKTVRVYDEAGKPLRAIGPRGAGFELRKPIDLAVDVARHIYVVEEEGTVFVFAPDGKLLTALSGEAIRKPKAVTVEPDGAVLVYDDRGERLVRFK